MRTSRLLDDNHNNARFARIKPLNAWKCLEGTYLKEKHMGLISVIVSDSEYVKSFIVGYTAFAETDCQFPRIHRTADMTLKKKTNVRL